MNAWKEAFRRLAYLFRRSRFDHDLEEELRFHLETRADELERTGITRAAALARARREFGPAARASEDTRSAWEFRWLEDLAADLRYAGRAFRRNPAFAGTAIACLALGIGANTTIFSLAEEVLFSRPSARDPESLVNIRIGGNSHAPMREYRFMRDAGIYDGLGGENEEYQVNWRHGAANDRLYAARVTENFFEVTGIPVALGRPIRTGDATAVVLSYGLWQRRFGGDPAVAGSAMTIDGRLYTVVGILPRDHRTVIGFGFSPDVYLTVPGDQGIVALYARVPQGLTRAALIGRTKAACQELDRTYPNGNLKWANDIFVGGVTGIDRIGGNNVIPIVAFFGMLMVVVGLVLLIACANVASMLLARAASRSQELAIRQSIGAGRWRLVRQLLAESLLLAVCGTTLGLALNLLLTRLMGNIRLPLPVPIQFVIQPDWRLLAYAAAVATLCCLATGLVPALRATHAGLSDALKHDEHQTARTRWTLRNALVTGQLAASIVLLAAGFLFLRNLVNASTSSPGFDLQHTIWSFMRLVPESYPTTEKREALISAALERLSTLPGVESAAIARIIPLNDQMTTGGTVRTDLSPQGVHVRFRENYVGPDYFRTMQIPIRQGREFLAADRQGVIINENLARRLFGAVNPVGHVLRFTTTPREIVGVAANSKYFTLGEEDQMALYETFGAGGRMPENLHFLVRSAGRPEALVPAVQATLARLDNTAALETKPMSQALVFALLPSRVGAAILGSMGVLGLVLASVGLYGVLLFAVSRRIREIGLRVALGASRRSILALVMRQSAALVGSGLAVGTALAVFAVKPMAMFLVPNVHPSDVSNFIVVGLVLTLVAFIATVPPALRALRVDPMVALRHE